MSSLPESRCNNCSSGSPPEVFCEQCQASMCKACRRDHQDTYALANHRLLPLTRGKEPIRYILCPEHQIYFNYYCQQCRRAMCRVCAAKNHKDHRALTLQDVGQKKRLEFNEVMKELTVMVNEFDKTKEEPGKMEAEARSLLVAAGDDCKVHLKQCRAALDQWEQKMEESFRDSKAMLRHDVERVLGERRNFLNKVKELEQEILELLQLGRPLEMMEKSVNVERSLENLRAKAHAVQNNSFVRGVEMTPTEPPKSYGQFNPVNVGPASDRDKLTFWVILSEKYRNKDSGEDQQESEEKTPTQYKKMQIDESADKLCLRAKFGDLLSPCDVHFMPDGELVLADWGNARILRFLSSGEMDTTLLDDVIPERLAVTPDGNLAVTDDKQRRVVVFSLDGKLIKEWKPEGLSRPCALAITREGCWVITDVITSQCNLYSPEGVLMHSIAGRSEGFIKPGDLDLPTYVTCDVIGRILVSDCNRHCVNVYSQEGDFLLRVGGRGEKDGQLLYPRGVCVDEANNILVSDWGNDRVSQFSPEGSFIRHVVTKEMMPDFGWPYGLSYLSGTLADNKPRLAVAGEGPDALIVIPYHHNAERIDTYRGREKPTRYRSTQSLNKHADQGNRPNSAHLHQKAMTEHKPRPGKISFKTHRSARSHSSDEGLYKVDGSGNEQLTNRSLEGSSIAYNSHKASHSKSKSEEGLNRSESRADASPRNRRIVSHGSNSNNISRKSTPGQGQNQGRSSRASIDSDGSGLLTLRDARNGRESVLEDAIIGVEAENRRPKTARTPRSSRTSRTSRTSWSSDLGDTPDLLTSSMFEKEKISEVNNKGFESGQGRVGSGRSTTRQVRGVSGRVSRGNSGSGGGGGAQRKLPPLTKSPDITSNLPDDKIDEESIADTVSTASDTSIPGGAYIPSAGGISRGRLEQEE